MIASGCSIISPDTYETYAEVGMRRAREAGSEVFALQAAGSIFRSHNLILDLAAAREDLQALVLVPDAHTKFNTRRPEEVTDFASRGNAWRKALRQRRR